MNFSQFILILLARKRVIFLTLLLTVTTTIGISLSMKKIYIGSASVLVDFKRSDPITGIVLEAQMMPGYMATQIEIISSHNVALKVVDRLKLTEDPIFNNQFTASTKGKGSIRDWLADNLLKQLEVKPARESSVINVSCSDVNPQFAADLANAFIWAYIQTNLELKVQPARQQAAWFDEQIVGLRNHVEELQKKLAEIQKESGLMPIEGHLDLESARLTEISTQLVQAQNQTYESVTRQRQIGGAKAKGKLDELPEILNNKLIQDLKAELGRAEGKFAEVSQRFEKNHPQYQSTQAVLLNLRQKLANEIQSVRGSMENSTMQILQKEEELKKALAEQKSRVLALKQQRDASDMITQDLASARTALDSTTLRATQMYLESQRSLTEIMILNPAVAPLKHSKPKLTLNIAISIFMGTLLGVGFVFLFEMIDRRIRSVDDVSEGLGLPVLAEISGLPAKKSKAFFHNGRGIH